MQVNPPRNEHALELALVQRAGNDNKRAKDDRTTMANAIVAQMLGEGVAVKGGSSLRFRYGSQASRFTMDFDVTRKIELDEFLKRFRSELAVGWQGFTGEVVILPQANPRGVPFEYVMQPLQVKLKYKNQSWCSVNIEISLGEAGCADSCDTLDPNSETLAVFQDLGFPPPKPIRIMPLDHQIAQKLRGLSGFNSRRAHDLIDLQLIMLHDADKIDLAAVGQICNRIFKHSDTPPWPTPISKKENWNSLYVAQIANLPVLQTIDEAVAWVNKFIAQIVQAAPATGAD